MDDFEDDDMFASSDAGLGKLGKKLFHRKVNIEKGTFGVPVDMNKNSGAFVLLLRTIWRSLQQLGVGDMKDFLVPHTFRHDAQETSTSLSVVIQGINKTSFDKKYKLTPPKAYNYLQNPESLMSAEEKASGIPIVPGMTVTIFRLVRDGKAPATAQFILTEKNKQDETVLTPKPFSITMGELSTPSPLYMDPERLNDLVEQGGSSVAMLFPRNAISKDSGGITDSLIRAQGGAYLLILDQSHLQWIVALKFSSLFAELPSTVLPAKGSGPAPPTDMPAPHSVLKPEAVKSTPPPPPAGGKSLEDLLKTAKEKHSTVKSDVRWAQKMPSHLPSSNDNESDLAVRSFDVDAYEATQLISNVEDEVISTGRRELSAVEKLILVQMAHALVTFAQDTTTIQYFADLRIKSTKLRALAYRVDMDALSMDRAMILKDEGLSKLETNGNNFMTGVMCIAAATYVKHTGQKFIKVNKAEDKVLETWLATTLDVGRFGNLPPQHFTDEVTDNIKIIATPPVDNIVNTFSICKYILARGVSLGIRPSVRALLAKATDTARMLVTTVLQTAVEDNRGSVINIPAILHIVITMLLAEAVYFFHESEVKMDFVNDLIVRALTASTNSDLEELFVQCSREWPIK